MKSTAYHDQALCRIPAEGEQVFRVRPGITEGVSAIRIKKRICYDPHAIRFVDLMWILGGAVPSSLASRYTGQTTAAGRETHAPGLQIIRRRVANRSCRLSRVREDILAFLEQRGFCQVLTVTADESDRCFSRDRKVTCF